MKTLRQHRINNNLGKDFYAHIIEISRNVIMYREKSRVKNNDVTFSSVTINFVFIEL